MQTYANDQERIAALEERVHELSDVVCNYMHGTLRHCKEVKAFANTTEEGYIDNVDRYDNEREEVLTFFLRNREAKYGIPVAS